jgi:integral membrane protein
LTGVGSAPAEVEPALRGRLLRYRFVAYVVGVFLLVLTLVAMPLEYIWHQDTLVGIVGPIHGFGYMVYLAVAFDLSRRARWSLKATLLVLLAGTVPFVSFVAERIVTRKLRAGETL